MRIVLPLLAMCAGCSGADAPPPVPEREYATQLEAPTPDYKALLAQPRSGGDFEYSRDRTAPLPKDAKAIGERWKARLEERSALLGYGLAGKGPDGPIDMIDTGLTAEEFDTWAAENGWEVPGHIRWSFVPAMALPSVSESAKDKIRVWPAATSRTGMQLEALLSGEVYLRDGCFYVTPFGGDEHLAFFHAEVGVDVDDEGYLYLRERVGGQYLGRPGEDMSWGGPASADQDADTVAALRAECGEGKIFVVGSPESSERFFTRYPHTRNPSPPPIPPDR